MSRAALRAAQRGDVLEAARLYAEADAANDAGCDICTSADHGANACPHDPRNESESGFDPNDPHTYGVTR